jgi:hypothetical protein
MRVAAWTAHAGGAYTRAASPGALRRSRSAEEVSVKQLCMLFLFTGTVAVPLADVWDVQIDNDDGITTDNVLVHGTTQTHDLAARPGPVADEDWYVMPQARQSSDEVLIDGVSGDLGAAGLTLARVGLDGTTILQTAEPTVAGTAGYSRALRFQNTAATTTSHFVRVSGGSCTTSCGAEDVYTIRTRETTISIARFNAPDRRSRFC